MNNTIQRKYSQASRSPADIRVADYEFLEKIRQISLVVEAHQVPEGLPIFKTVAPEGVNLHDKLNYRRK